MPGVSGDFLAGFRSALCHAGPICLKRNGPAIVLGGRRCQSVRHSLKRDARIAVGSALNFPAAWSVWQSFGVAAADTFTTSPKEQRDTCGQRRRDPRADRQSRPRRADQHGSGRIEFAADELLWVLGGPNGVGKSAVFDAMTYAPYAEDCGGAAVRRRFFRSLVSSENRRGRCGVHGPLPAGLARQAQAAERVSGQMCRRVKGLRLGRQPANLFAIQDETGGRTRRRGTDPGAG